MTQTSTNGNESAIAVFIDFENFALGFEHRASGSRSTRSSNGWSKRARSSSRGPTPTGAASGLHDRAPRGGHRADRDSQARRRRQELRRHPPRGGCDRPGVLQDHIDTFVDRLRRQRFLAARLQAQGDSASTSSASGMQDSTSDLLRDNCDEFIYYEDLERTASRSTSRRRSTTDLPELKRKAFAAAARHRCSPCGARTRKSL